MAAASALWAPLWERVVAPARPCDVGQAGVARARPCPNKWAAQSPGTHECPARGRFRSAGNGRRSRGAFTIEHLVAQGQLKIAPTPPPGPATLGPARGRVWDGAATRGKPGGNPGDKSRIIRVKDRSRCALPRFFQRTVPRLSPGHADLNPWRSQPSLTFPHSPQALLPRRSRSIFYFRERESGLLWQVGTRDARGTKTRPPPDPKPC